LFFTLDVHLRELKKVWTDELVIEEVWKNFHGKADLQMGGFRSICESCSLLLDLQIRAHVDPQHWQPRHVSVVPGQGRGRGEDFGWIAFQIAKRVLGVAGRALDITQNVSKARRRGMPIFSKMRLDRFHASTDGREIVGHKNEVLIDARQMRQRDAEGR
jgi:hypothetical protein